MRYGYCINGFEDFNANIDLACEAEEAGWDGFFVPDGLAIEVPDQGPLPLFDPWVLMGAIAVRTTKIHFGTMITPLSRRRPWKVARECVTVDHLSKGRFILGAGLGAATDDGGFHKVGEAMDVIVRAEQLDEALAIVDGLWKGEPYTFNGRHFQVDNLRMLPLPFQSPRIPIWVVGVWGKPRSMRRALAWDGIIPQRYKEWQPFTADDIRRIRDYVLAERLNARRLEIVAGGLTGSDANGVRAFAEAGATWWVEGDMGTLSFEKVRERLRQGPPA
jgi:alkanesulfonate monooxygenase SsuD/methylene tetrahydromethanopterin reductase-like flavin-dependent oxidoreductase (luciferase family)